MLGIWLELGLLEPGNDAIAEEQRVTQCLERQRVPAHALDDVESRIGSTSEHQLIVAEHAGALTEVLKLARGGVDLADLCHGHVAAMNHLSVGRDHVARHDRSANHLGQQWVEGYEVLLADERQGPVGRQRMLQQLRSSDTGTSAADNHQVLVHGCPSPIRLACPSGSRVSNPLRHPSCASTSSIVPAESNGA